MQMPTKTPARPAADLDAVRGAWDAEAPLRSAELRRGDPSYQALSDYLCRSAERLCRTEPLLDAGCGVGFLTERLAARGHEVIGADLSARSLALARSLHRRQRLDFKLCDVARPLPEWEGVFGLVLANMVLHNTPDLVGFLRGCHRVLRPGGAILITLTEPRSYLQKQGVDHPYDESRRFEFPLRPRRSRAPHLPVPYWHRPHTAYVEGLALAGFSGSWQERPGGLGGARPRDVLAIGATRPTAPRSRPTPASFFPELAALS